MVRRSEFVVAKAIRKGQSEGTVSAGRGGDHGNQWTGGKADENSSAKPTPEDIEPNFYNNGPRCLCG